MEVEDRNIGNSTVSTSQSGSNDKTLSKETGSKVFSTAQGFMKNVRSRLLPINGEPTQSFKADASFKSAPGEKDWRVKLSIPNVQSFQNSTMLEPLRQTSGLTFPYTPTIILSHTANYSPISPVHNNYPFYAYNNSSVDQMTITGEFFVQTSAEGTYWVSMLHYLRSVTKMFYGQDSNRGTPPPVLRFSAHGAHMFNSFPVVVSGITITLEDNTDYLNVEVVDSPQGSSTTTQVPMTNLFSIQLTPVFSRKRTLDFSLREYAKGNLIGKAGGPGGFI